MPNIPLHQVWQEKGRAGMNVKVGDKVYCKIDSQVVSAEVLAIRRVLWFKRYLCRWRVDDHGDTYMLAGWKWRVW